MKYLIAHGVTNARLTALGYGMERPLVDNGSASNRDAQSPGSVRSLGKQ